MRANKRFKSINFLIKGLLGYVAYIAIFPDWLSPLIHKCRGVKIKDCLNVYIAPNVLIDSLFPELITIEEDVFITRGVKIISHFNPSATMRKIMGREIIKGAVHIKKGAFLGVNSIILPNVTIGTAALIQAGAVVKKDVPDYAVAAGNPAEIIGDIRRPKVRRWQTGIGQS